MEKEKKAKMRKIKRFALIGAATVGGGALLGENTHFFMMNCTTLLILKVS